MPRRPGPRRTLAVLAVSLAIAACGRATPPTMSSPALTGAGDLAPGPAAAPSRAFAATPVPHPHPPVGPDGGPVVPFGQTGPGTARLEVPPGAATGSPTGPAPLPAAAGPAVSPSVAPPVAAPELPPPPDGAIDLKLLVVAARRDEVELAAITRVLDTLGTPYDVWVAREHPGGLTADVLAHGRLGHYQGLVFTTGDAVYADGGRWQAALAPAEWQAIADYERTFHVREVAWYAWPDVTDGFDTATTRDTTAQPLDLTPTAEGTRVFALAGPHPVVPVRDAYAYLARPVEAATTPLLVDGAGHTLAAIRRTPDGRERLLMSFDSNPALLHTALVGYGAIRWVTRGVFIGARRPTASPQVDDVFYPNTLYGGNSFRLGGTDLLAAAAWQRARREDPVTAALRLSLVFNGEGATGSFTPDTLTPAATSLAGEFAWVGHTFTHADLDAADEATTQAEIAGNTDVASRLHLAGYGTEALVTGGLTGLANPRAMAAAYAAGVRYVVTDTSRPGGDNPRPNDGIPNRLQPGILMIPRRPTNLFYDVSTPEQWVARYNAAYHGYWGRDLTYAEILDRESDTLLADLARGDLDPWSFGQANLRAYDGTRSVLGDLLGRVFDRYAATVGEAIACPTMAALGQEMAAHMALARSGVVGRWLPGGSVVLAAGAAVTVPLTGPGGTSEVSLQPGAPVTVPVSGSSAP